MRRLAGFGGRPLRRFAGPLVLVAGAALPVALHPGLWRLLAVLAAPAVALAVTAVALRATRLVVWALAAVCAEAAVALEAHGRPAHAWAVALALVLALAAEWTFAEAAGGPPRRRGPPAGRPWRPPPRAPCS